MDRPPPSTPPTQAEIDATPDVGLVAVLHRLLATTATSRPATQEAVPRDAPRAAAEPDSVASAEHAPLDVLVIEDDAVVRSAMMRVLAREGWTVDAVEDGVAALNVLGEQAYRALLTDIKMPNLDGMRLYLRLLAKDPPLAASVVFVTAYADDRSIRAFLRASGRPVVTKPFDTPLLARAVRRVLSGEPAPGTGGFARRLPEIYLRQLGQPRERVEAIVAEFWPWAPEGHRRDLVERLRTILAQQDLAWEIPDSVRDLCEMAVLDWLSEPL